MTPSQLGRLVAFSRQSTTKQAATPFRILRELSRSQISLRQMTPGIKKHIQNIGTGNKLKQFVRTSVNLARLPWTSASKHLPESVLADNAVTTAHQRAGNAIYDVALLGNRDLSRDQATNFVNNAYKAKNEQLPQLISQFFPMRKGWTPPPTPPELPVPDNDYW